MCNGEKLHATGGINSGSVDLETGDRVEGRQVQFLGTVQRRQELKLGRHSGSTRAPSSLQRHRWLLLPRAQKPWIQVLRLRSKTPQETTFPT